MAKKSAAYEIGDQNRLILEYPGLDKEKHHFQQQQHVIFGYQHNKPVYLEIKLISKKRYEKISGNKAGG